MARTNYLTAPSFEYNTDGPANRWAIGENCVGTPTFSKVSDEVVAGDYAQRIVYTGVSGDTNQSIYLTSDDTAAGSFVENDSVYASAYVWGALSGVTLKLRLTFRNAAGGPISSIDSDAITLDSTPTRYSVNGTCPALTNRVCLAIGLTAVAEGDTVDMHLDCAMVEKAASLGDYFDGDTSNTEELAHFWTGAANLSTSTEDVFVPGIACVTGIPMPATVPLSTARGEVNTCAKVFNGLFDIDIDTEDIAVSASTDYHVSCYLYAPTIVDPCTITVETGTSHELAVLAEVNTDWVRYDVDASTGVGETTMHLTFALGNGPCVVYVAGLLIEQTDSLKSYFDGNFVGCDWDGAENASVSRTRWR